MSAKKIQTSQSTSLGLEQANESSSGYIDDYSHLRLSYYQYRSALSDKSSGTSADTSTQGTFDTALIDLSDTSQPSIVETEDERRNIRDYHVSQIPDLPDPSYVAASIISSASHNMGPVHGVHFRYNDRIEQESRIPDSQNDLEFDPPRRSTMKPNQFPIAKRFPGYF